MLSSKNGGDIISTVNEQGQQVPASTTYMLSVPLEIDIEDDIVIDGGTGVAKTVSYTHLTLPTTPYV